jgi:hypothetical protein
MSCLADFHSPACAYRKGLEGQHGMTAKELRNLILDAVAAAIRDGKLPGLVMAQAEVYPDQARFRVLTQSGEGFELTVEKTQ